MKKISGFCERCETMSPFLTKKDERWLCTMCRDESYMLDRIIGS